MLEWILLKNFDFVYYSPKEISNILMIGFVLVG